MKTPRDLTTRIDASLQEIHQYYQAPQVFERLRPPWKQGVEATNISKDGFQSIGSIPKEGSYLCEQHFHKVSETQTDVSCSVQGSFSLSSALIKRLERKVLYEHKILQEDLRHKHLYPTSCSLRILITGASGFVGHHLLLLLRVFGHQVFTLVRKEPREAHEIYWDPYLEKITLEEIEHFDAVIHLSGETIVSWRWTQGKKQAIEKSRLSSTRFLAESLNHLEHPPKTFLCASAVGFYGNTQGRWVDESGSQGEGFLSDVCARWEESARCFTRGRVVSTRFGTVLGLQGGFLQKIVPLMRRVGGCVLGTGSEYLSWISLEDLGYQMMHLLHHPEIHGPVNFTTPYPVTSEEMLETLAKMLQRPVWMHLPPWCVKLLLGEMGQAQFLNSLRVKPSQLQDAQAYFSYPRVEEALQWNLGVLPFSSEKHF